MRVKNAIVLDGIIFLLARLQRKKATKQLSKCTCLISLHQELQIYSKLSGVRVDSSIFKTQFQRLKIYSSFHLILRYIFCEMTILGLSLGFFHLEVELHGLPALLQLGQAVPALLTLSLYEKY